MGIQLMPKIQGSMWKLWLGAQSPLQHWEQKVKLRCCKRDNEPTSGKSKVGDGWPYGNGWEVAYFLPDLGKTVRIRVNLDDGRCTS